MTIKEHFDLKKLLEIYDRIRDEADLHKIEVAFLDGGFDSTVAVSVVSHIHQKRTSS